MTSVFTDHDSAVAYLTRDGADDGLRVPCSRYGATTEECAPVAVAAAFAYVHEVSDELTPETLDLFMGLVVNDHDDIQEWIARD